MKVRAVGLWRLVHTAALIARGMWIVATQFPRLSQDARDAHVRRWSRQMLAALHIRLIVEGAYDPRARLMVANHVSWLDILAINAAQPTRFVGKSELKSWPILGWLIANTGTVFIERAKRRDAVRVVHHMTDVLRAGQHVTIFPEGTTGDGHQVLGAHGPPGAPGPEGCSAQRRRARRCGSASRPSPALADQESARDRPTSIARSR